MSDYGNLVINPDGSMTIGSPWTNSALPDPTTPEAVDVLAGPLGYDILADLECGPADAGAVVPVDGVSVATGLGHLDAAAANWAGLAPAGTSVVYDPYLGQPTFYEPGDFTPDPWVDGFVDGY
ncbi:hypothetical protein ACI8AA_04900 [Geodermatophilus sp. SYSU D01180]